MIDHANSEPIAAQFEQSSESELRSRPPKLTRLVHYRPRRDFVARTTQRALDAQQRRDQNVGLTGFDLLKRANVQFGQLFLCEPATRQGSEAAL